MDYKYVDVKEFSPLEKSLVEFCALYFGEKEPYQRKLSEKFFDVTLNEIRQGDVYLATPEEEDSFVGACIICPPSLDKRIESFAAQSSDTLYLAALIVKNKFQRSGHGKALFKEALKGRTGQLSLITPTSNISAIQFYKALGMTERETFDQIETSIKDAEAFNMPRVIMSGDIGTILEKAAL